MTPGSDPPLGAAPDAAARTGAAAATPAPEAPVLARGHLHPAILLLRLLDALRQVVVLVLFGVVVDRWILVLAAVVFLLQLGYALARYLTLEYTLTASELRVREGLLERQERRIPLDRIQDLGFESTILRRALGLCVVLVETASGRGVEARLDALSRADAEHLREVLLAARREATAAAAAAPAAGEGGAAAVPVPASEPEPEWTVHQSTAGDLMLRGLTDLRLSAFLVTGFAALQFADQFGFLARLRGLAEGFQSWLGQFQPLLIALLLGAMLVAVLALGVVTATLGNLVQFHGFVLTLRGDVLQRRFGLLTTRAKTLPRPRIQRVTVEQTWLRRLLGLAVVKADSAGGSRGHGEDTTGGWDVVVPMAAARAADALLPALLPGIERTEFAWQPSSPRLVLRATLQGLVLSLVAFAAALEPFGARALFAFALLPLWLVRGVLIWRNLGFALGERFFALRHGIVGQYFAYVPTAKVQAVVVRQNPIDQLLGLADVTVFVAGGSPTRLPNVVLGDAEALRGRLAALAAAAAARDW